MKKTVKIAVFGPMERVVERNLETVSKFIEASRTFAIDFFQQKDSSSFLKIISTRTESTVEIESYRASSV
jgi:hypothetical protein